MPISAPDVQQGWSSHQLPGARYFILTHESNPHKWLIAVASSSTLTFTLFLLALKSINPDRDADRYWTIGLLPGGNQNSTSSTNCIMEQWGKKKAVKKFAHIEAFRLSYKGRGNKTLPQILDSHIQHEHNRLFSPRCEEWSCPALFSWPDNHYKSSKFPTKYQRLQGVSNS